jgi:hypothetical protein
VDVHAFADSRELGYNLNAGGSNANHSDSLVSEVVILIPACRVDELPCEGVDALNVRPFPVAGGKPCQRLFTRV